MVFLPLITSSLKATLTEVWNTHGKMKLPKEERKIFVLHETFQITEHPVQVQYRKK